MKPAFLFLATMIPLLISQFSSQAQSFFGRPDSVLMDMMFKQKLPQHVIEEFEMRNKQRMNTLQDSLRLLPIDRCRYQNLVIVMIIDEQGTIQGLSLQTKHIPEQLKQVIFNLIKNHRLGWSPAFHMGHKIPVIFHAVFVLGEFYEPIRVSRGFNHSYLSFNNSIIVVGRHSKRCGDAEYYFELGNKSFTKENYRGAGNMYRKVLKLNPYDLDANYNLAMSLLRLNKKEEACKYFSRCSGYGADDCKEAFERHCNN